MPAATESSVHCSNAYAYERLERRVWEVDYRWRYEGARSPHPLGQAHPMSDWKTGRQRVVTCGDGLQDVQAVIESFRCMKDKVATEGGGWALPQVEILNAEYVGVAWDFYGIRKKDGG